jgi:hypothetical protein
MGGLINNGSGNGETGNVSKPVSFQEEMIEQNGSGVITSYLHTRILRADMICVLFAFAICEGRDW